MSAPVTSVPVRANPPALGPETQVAWPKRTVTTLSNGLQVVLVESHTFPKISAQLFFRSGNSVVAHTAPGLSEMTATVVRMGTATRPSRKIEEDLRRMGAGLGTSSGADSSAISAAGLAEYSSGILELMADLARHASFPEDDFERERRQRLEELKIERTTPGFLASERLRRVLFGAHPYAVVAPSEEQLASITRDQLAEFYRKHYVPAESLLIVVGDFAAARMLEQIEAIFGAWQAPKAAHPASAAPPHQSGRRVHLVHLPGTVQTQVLLGNLSITRRDPDWYRLLLANSIFGGAFHSRLVLNIREQKGYTYSPGSGVNALRQQGYFTVRAAVRNDVVAATLTEMFYEIDRMRSLPVTAEELDSARQLSHRRVLARRCNARWITRPTSHCLSRSVAGGISRNLSRANSRAHSRRRAHRRTPPLRFGQRADRHRRRPRPDRRASGSIRSRDGIRRERQRTSVRQASWFRRTTAPIRVCCAALLFVTIAASTLVAKNPPTHKIDINSASAKELQELPGVGPTTAKAIIQFRTKSGSFHRVEDLLAIRGISETKLAKMRPYITVGTPPPPKKSSSLPAPAH